MIVGIDREVSGRGRERGGEERGKRRREGGKRRREREGVRVLCSIHNTYSTILSLLCVGYV